MKSALPTNEQVRALVVKYVDQHQPETGYRLVVPDQGVKFVDNSDRRTAFGPGYFVVAVHAEPMPDRRFEYYDRLQEIEEDIIDHEQISVSILPAIPNDL